MAKVIIVSNRLPVSVKKVEGKLVFNQSTGGVATGLSSYANNPGSRWIGWPGIPNDELTDSDRRKIKRELLKDNCVPVWLTKKQIDDFYNGYSNSVLWPLFHNLPLTASKQHAQWWRGYQAVNKAYSELIIKEADPKSRVWIHDYQLLLVPKQVKVALPSANIGLFSHIPFPPPKLFAKLPEAKKLLQGMLGAQLIGFHTQGYVNNFLDSCERLDAGTAGNGQVVIGGRAVRVTDFPMGIDYNKFAKSGKSPAVRAAVKKYKRRYRGQKLIVAVDRLDPSKGLVGRLEAYREFLRQNPQLHGKVTFSMVAAPSRTDIAVYKNLGSQLGKLAAAINHEFGDAKWQPIDYINEVLPFENVSALLQLADVAFIAPIRDGMNLVAKEYVASRKRGVLILSETAGAAQELQDALLVNPFNPATVVTALEESLKLSKREVKRRFKSMKKQLSTNTVHYWADNFMKTLQQPVPGTAKLHTPRLGASQAARIKNAYLLAGRRLLLLDYDGTLSAYSDDYLKSAPSNNLRRLLKKLTSDPKNDVVIISGRSRRNLEDWFGDLPVGLVAEHGALSRSPGGKTWHSNVPSSRTWKAAIKPIMETYAALTPRASVEEKQFSLVWHYRGAPAFAAQKNLQILQRLLKPLVKQYRLGLFHGSKILEVKNPEVHKGNAIRRWLRHDHDFILALGDDLTDEDMFQILPPSANTVKVGRGHSVANYRLASPTNVLKFLQHLAG